MEEVGNLQESAETKDDIIALADGDEGEAGSIFLSSPIPALASDQPAPTATVSLTAATPADLLESPKIIDVHQPLSSSTEEIIVTKTTSSPATDDSARQVQTSDNVDGLLLNFEESLGEGDGVTHQLINQDFNSNRVDPPGSDLLGLHPISGDDAPLSVSNSNSLIIGGPLTDPFGAIDTSDRNSQEAGVYNVADEKTPFAEDLVVEKMSANHQQFENVPTEDTSIIIVDPTVDQRSSKINHIIEKTVDDELMRDTKNISSLGDLSPVIAGVMNNENVGKDDVKNIPFNHENVEVSDVIQNMDEGFSVAPTTSDQAEFVDGNILEETTHDREVGSTDDIHPQLSVDVNPSVTSSSESVVRLPKSPQHITEDDGAEANVGEAVSDSYVNTIIEERTEEEEEWLSMGLGLGDALRQIVALTEERDASLALCQANATEKTQAEALLVEVQSRLEVEMNRRAESDSEKRKLRETLKSYEDRLKAYETMEDDLEKVNVNLVTVVTEKSKIELEVQKLREMIDESQQKEVVLSNRLNEAKKKEANKSTAAGRLEEENEKLRLELQQTKDELETVSKTKTKLESNMEKLKVKAVERVKQAETALAEERELNEERKKKMKTFVETKAEELRDAKETASNMQKELEETRASLRSSRDREEACLKQLEDARLKHRELQRDMERMVRNSEQLHKAGNSLEQELEKYASETEEHKKKRMSAKHEIMQMVRTLEAERAVSAKLKESMKFTFTPKALSQQELLSECLRDFELELERLAAKTGKALQPSTDRGDSSDGVTEISEINGSLQKSKKIRASKADMDTERLISNLEQETQHVSKGIMSLAGDIERMRSLLNEDSGFGCIAYFSNILPRAGEARHQRLGDGGYAHYEKSSANRFA